MKKHAKDKRKEVRRQFVGLHVSTGGAYEYVNAVWQVSYWKDGQYSDAIEHGPALYATHDGVWGAFTRLYAMYATEAKKCTDPSRQVVSMHVERYDG